MDDIFPLANMINIRDILNLHRILWRWLKPRNETLYQLIAFPQAGGSRVYLGGLYVVGGVGVGRGSALYFTAEKLYRNHKADVNLKGRIDVSAAGPVQTQASQSLSNEKKTNRSPVSLQNQERSSS